MSKTQPLYQRMIALARAGHDHAAALQRDAHDLRSALVQMDEADPGPQMVVAMRKVLKLTRRAKLTWFRATGKQVDGE